VSGEPPGPLAPYRDKRDPARTPEPFGGRPGAGPPRFVVQQHRARRLHWDLRLEVDGVLRSWAVPRGPSVRLHERRLAVEVEDHPLDYADFEGVIPAGSYGAGPVIVWDRGPYRVLSPGDPAAQLARGRLDVELLGWKLRGAWTLVRTARAPRQWLLLKKADGGAADQEVTERYPRSVLSGLTVDERADPAAALAPVRERVAALGAPRREVSARPAVLMLASPAGEPVDDPGWLFEIKYDGVRVLAERRGDAVRLVGRGGPAVTGAYPEVAEALRRLAADRFLLDGEVVALDERGRPSFQLLQARPRAGAAAAVARAAAATPVVAVFFDVLALDGHDLRGLPLAERAACLARLLPPLGTVRYADHVRGRGRAFYEAAAEQGLEGVVAKRAASPYVAGRSRDWLKIRCQRRQEFVVGGYTDPRGSRQHLGALHLGLYEGTRLVYVGRVGTGLDDRALADLRGRLLPLARPTPPFAGNAPAGRGHHWVEPRLVAEVRFAEWTRDGSLRHPAFLGLRPDVRPQDCRREEAASAARPGAAPDATAAARAPAPGPGPTGRAAAGVTRPGAAGSATTARAAQGRVRQAATARAGAAGGPAAARAQAPADVAAARRVAITNPGKLFWPREGYTKADLVAYYEAVAPRLLPYLRDRPVVLTRYPDGIDGKSFFQKDAPASVPSWVRTTRLEAPDGGRPIDAFVVDDADTLRYLANLGTIPLHVWSARLGSLDRPDWLVLDLDPKGAPFADVVAVARALRRVLAGAGVPSYPKTSGGDGLHLLVPLGARYGHEEARAFARVVATLAAQAEPARATLARPLAARGGRVYLDVGQNGAGRTLVAPFAVRARPGAPVSCPLRWAEVTPRLDPARFTIRTVPPRAARTSDPLAPVLGPGIDMAAALARLRTRLARTPPGG
jgi:bifunctional non-homologous end joining protein LigD